MKEQEKKSTVRPFLQRVEDTLKERESKYPAYATEAEKIAKIWETLYPNSPMTSLLVPRFMVVLKLVRDSGSSSDDHLIDAVGYIAKAMEM